MSASLRAFDRSKLAQFRAWRTPSGRSPQGAFLRAAATHRARVFRSGNQLGKTTVGGVDTLLHLLGWHPWAIHQPPVHWWASGLDWELGIGQIMWPAMREVIPWDQVRRGERGVSWLRKGIPLTIPFKNDSLLHFKSADAGRRKYQGSTLHGIWLDEEHEPDVVEEARTRLVKHKGYLSVTLTPIMRKRWVQDLEREAGTFVVRTSMHEAAAAGLLDPDEVKRYAASLPERQRRVRVSGDHVALEGLVYPEFDRTTHVATPQGGELMVQGKAVAPWPLPAHWPRWAAIDWGIVNPTAVLIVAEDAMRGRLIVERCYYSPGIRASVWAELLKTRLPKLVVPLVSDHDAQARAECEAGGIHTTAARKSIDPGLESVARLFKGRCDDGAPKVIVVEDERILDRVLGLCDGSKLSWELEAYHYPTARDGRPSPRDLPVDKDNHACDALRYLIRSWESGRGGPPSPPRIRQAPRRPEGALLSLPDGRAEPIPRVGEPHYGDE